LSARRRHPSGTVTTDSTCPSPRATAVYKHIQAVVNYAEPGDVLLIAAGGSYGIKRG